MRRMRNFNLDGIDPSNQIELQNSIESILEILMALNEEIVKRWIKAKYPHGIGLYETIASPPIREELNERLQKTRIEELGTTIKDTFNCAVCISTTKSVNWCEAHERFECDDCHTNEQKVNPLIVS